jgi:Ca2+-transporting ATPase
MAFTVLMLFQLFNLFNARSDERTAFRGLFANRWLLAAIALSVVLQVCVVHAPWLQRAFSTESLSASDWWRCVSVASTVFWVRELQKALLRATRSRLPVR